MCVAVPPRLLSLMVPQLYIHEMIRTRRDALVKEERHDLFSGLLEATEKDGDGEALNDMDLVGECCV